MGTVSAVTAWDNAFLTLGGRLRPIYGSQVSFDRRSEEYVVTLSEGTIVRIACPAHATRGSAVRASCVVLNKSGLPNTLMEFALRENARLRLARLCVDGDALTVDYALPFAAACGSFLEEAVAAVAAAARELRAELDIVSET
ncbi:MAG: hypothetical protein ABW167_20070 [Baekduia sp.]